MMKKIVSLIVVAMFIGIAPTTIHAQGLLNVLGEKAKEKVKEKVEKKVQKAVKIDAEPKAEPEEEIEAPVKETKVSKSVESNYAKSDFVPGDVIFFEDNLEGEQLGEFPSRWDLNNGTAEVAKHDGKMVIFLENDDAQIMPLIKGGSKDYLPDQFTMEFDYWCNGEEDYNACIHLRLVYADEDWAEIKIATENDVTWNYRKPQGDFVDGSFAFDGRIENMDSWNHFALSFNKRAMKIYINGTRVANIPNCEVPKYFTIGGESWDDHRYFLTNFRVAKGAVPLYDRVMTDGKIVTYAITFDTGKANVKPESMTEIARIVKLMKDNPSLNFEIQGHCDNTGSAATNDRLSQQRAEAIMKKLVEQGIDASRLTAVGKGSKVPIADNSTDEGRALNRRVEFVKK